MRVTGKIITMLLLVLSALFGACSDKGRLPKANMEQETAVAEVSIVTVEKRTDPAGTTEFVIPEAAVFRRGALTGVYVVGGDGRAVVRWINPGRSANGELVVLGGLDAGEQVAGSASVGLVDGAPVKAQVSETNERESHE
ncbi:MAG: hypothetical protein HGA77_02965 [Chlorobiaceae bacterium]|nr:hypothetical protein [Chlorobiaceae bacterium]